jgi:hypothetical protein
MYSFFCENCANTFDEPKTRKSGLGDDPWGAGESFISEEFCPECDSMDIRYVKLCPKCAYEPIEEYEEMCRCCKSEEE